MESSKGKQAVEGLIATAVLESMVKNHASVMLAVFRSLPLVTSDLLRVLRSVSSNMRPL
jgi:hypothetical protein